MRGRREVIAAGAAVFTAWPWSTKAGAAGALVDPAGGVLGPLLARNRERYTGGARGTNHTSMALLAFASLGATSSQLAEFGDGMLRRNKKPFPEGAGTLTRQTWQSSLGRMEAMPAFRRFFSRELAEVGVAGTLRSYLPWLLPGLAAAEFHCMIRTAYGVRFGDADEVAIGLAYWSSAFMPLGSLGIAGSVSEPLESLRAVRSQFESAHLDNTEGGMAGAIKAASTVGGFQVAASNLVVDGKSLGKIAEAMVHLFAAPRGDLLHAVTGTHAYRTLEPYMPDRLLGRRYLWQALVAYYMAVGFPDLSTLGLVPRLPSWADVLAAAKTAPDDHGVKITHTALEEYQVYRNVLYLQVAARRWGLV